jgi:inosose dehydratase
MCATSLSESKSASQQSRRHFLREFSAALAVGAVASPLSGLAATAANEPSARKTLVGSNVYGWTQYAQRDKKPFDIGEVISALRDTGYDYLESWLNVDHPDENGHFAGQLRAKGLKPVSLYVGARLHETSMAKNTVDKILAAGKVCREAGFQVISCNAEPIGREKTDEELKTQTAALTDLGEGLNALGLKLGVHQHLPEMVNHAREFHYGFDHTKPNVVGWCYDVHWVWKGGIMPLEALTQYGERVVTWHLRQSRNRIWLEELATGDIDYSAVAKYARDHNLPRRFSVEIALEDGTKITRSGIENHRRSREFVRKVFES